MQTYGLTDRQISAGLGRSAKVVAGWHDYPLTRPIYLDRALRALASGARPLTNEQMHKLDLVTMLGIPGGTARYFQTTGEYPRQMRMAAALVDDKPSPYDLRILRNLDTARVFYHTHRGTYKARRRDIPAVKVATMRRLESLGYVETTATTATLTTKGRIICTSQATPSITRAKQLAQSC